MEEKFQILIFRKQSNLKKTIKFDTKLVSKTNSINVKDKDVIGILNKLEFETKKNNKHLQVKVPSWRPDIFGEIDLVEEVIRILGFENVKSIEPEKVRTKPTLNYYQTFSFSPTFSRIQRAIAKL